MDRKYWIIALLTLLPTGAGAQMVMLNSDTTHYKLWFDVNRVFNYNLYEHARWGGGLQCDIKLNSRVLRQLTLGGYVAYGYADERVKWGVKTDLMGCSKREPHLYAEFFHDLTRDASRTLDDYSVSNFSANDGFMASQFSDCHRLTAGLSSGLGGKYRGGAEVRLSREQPLYNPSLLLYPKTREEWDLLPTQRYLETRLFFSHEKGWKGELLTGYSRGDLVERTLFARALLQYAHTYPLGFLDLQCYAQGGTTVGKAPYSRMFDLGGISGSPLLLERSLVTARPNEFISDYFGLTILTLGLHKPLFSFYNEMLQLGSRPRPFVTAGAIWGGLWGDGVIGNATTGFLELQAPDRGIAEVGAGIHGILRWGYVDWGLAVAFRLTPPSAPYHLTGIDNNRVWILTAELSL